MSTYLTFLALAALLAIAPGPDTFLTLRATVVGGRRRGVITAAGITMAGAIQGVLAAVGLGALLVQAEPAFFVIRWAGVVYLTWLGLNALRDALRRDGSVWSVGTSGAEVSARVAFRQGFLCNITNPKVLAFNLAVLPQFVGADQGLPALLSYALTLVVVGTLFLLTVVQMAALVAGRITRPVVRRSIDGATGTVMLGFATALALEA